MKILQVINIGYPAGGAESSVLLLRNELIERGHEVKVLSSDIKGSGFFADYQVERIEESGVARIFKYLFYFKTYKKARKILKEFRPDIIHFHTTHIFSPAIFFASRNIPAVLTVHGPEPYTLKLLPWTLVSGDYKGGSFELNDLTILGLLHYLYFRYLLRPIYLFCFKKVSLVIAPSKYFSETLIHDIPRKKIQQIYNGIALPSPKPIRGYNRALYVGRLERVKGVDYLIEAFADLVLKFPQSELHIIGDGSHRGALEDLVKKLNLTDKIIFRGWVKAGQAVISEYEDASLLIIPSVWPENLPTVCIEALAVGRPVIGTNTGGIPELIEDGKTGYLVPIKDSRLLANALSKLLNNPSKLEEMGAEAEKIATKFDAKTFVDNIEHVYKTILK